MKKRRRGKLVAKLLLRHLDIWILRHRLTRNDGQLSVVVRQAHHPELSRRRVPSFKFRVSGFGFAPMSFPRVSVSPCLAGLWIPWVLAMSENEVDGRLLWLSNQFTCAGRPSPRSTTKTVSTGYYPPLNDITQFPFINMVWSTVVHRNVKRQVEITVVESPVPTDADLVAAHESWNSSRVKGIG